MPTTTLLYDGPPELLPMQGRSPGMHVSRLIHELCVELGHYEPRSDDDAADQLAARLAGFELGNDFEWAAIERSCAHDPHRYVRCGELQLDNVAGTPDLLDLVEETVHEMKCTWMSAKHQPGSQKFWKYEVQMKAYCHMLGWRRSLLRVRHVNGYWNFGQKGWGVVDRRWLYEWEESELTGCWKMLMDKRDELTQKEGTK